MAVIDIRRPHGGDPKATRAAVERVARSIATDYGIAHHWTGDELHFDRSGVKGHIAIEPADVHVHIELGFLLGAMKPRIEREIGRKLDEYLA